MSSDEDSPSEDEAVDYRASLAKLLGIKEAPAKTTQGRPSGSGKQQRAVFGRL